MKHYYELQNSKQQRFKEFHGHNISAERVIDTNLLGGGWAKSPFTKYLQIQKGVPMLGAVQLGRTTWRQGIEFYFQLC